MSSRYDTRTTTFSPEGRLYQVEYAVEAIRQAGTALGLLTADGVVLAAERPPAAPLAAVEETLFRGGKLAFVAPHISVAIAGVTADAETLLPYLRSLCARPGDAVLPEEACRRLCDLQQGYTQWGGVRPFGVAFLLAGYSYHRGVFELWQTDPSGNYSGWQAQAMGAADAAAVASLRQGWKPNLSLEQGIQLATKVLRRTTDVITLSPENIEVVTLSKSVAASIPRGEISFDAVKDDLPPQFKKWTTKELEPLVAEAMRLEQEEEKSKSNEGSA